MGLGAIETKLAYRALGLDRAELAEAAEIVSRTNGIEIDSPRLQQTLDYMVFAFAGQPHEVLGTLAAYKKLSLVDFFELNGACKEDMPHIICGNLSVWINTHSHTLVTQDDVLGIGTGNLVALKRSGRLVDQAIYEIICLMAITRQTEQFKRFAAPDLSGCDAAVAIYAAIERLGFHDTREEVLQKIVRAFSGPESAKRAALVSKLQNVMQTAKV